MYVEPAIQNFAIQRGDTFEWVFDIEIDGVILNLSTADVYAVIRTKDDISAPVIETFTVSINAQNEVTISLTDAETAAVEYDNGYWDVLVVIGTDKTHYIKGAITFTGTCSTVPVP